MDRRRSTERRDTALCEFVPNSECHTRQWPVAPQSRRRGRVAGEDTACIWTRSSGLPQGVRRTGPGGARCIASAAATGEEVESGIGRRQGERERESWAGSSRDVRSRRSGQILCVVLIISHFDSKRAVGGGDVRACRCGQDALALIRRIPGRITRTRRVRTSIQGCAGIRSSLVSRSAPSRAA